MKTISVRLLGLLLALLLPLSAAPAETGDDGEESLIDGDYLTEWMAAYGHGQGMDRDWQDFSVGFCYTATGDCWYYNGDVFMYSASMYKVPVSMLIAEKVTAGELSWEDSLQGSTAEYLVSGALIRSNNDFGHVLVSYLGGSYRGKCSDMSIAYTDLDPSYFPREFFEQSYYSARYMTQVMLTLYRGGEERFPRVTECLLQAQPNEYMNLKLKDRWPVAQKYGAYDEQNGYNNNHDAAIIFTPTPIVVVVMTRNVGDYQNHIANVANFLAEYSLTLDEKLAQREARQAEEAARQAEEAARREALAEEAARQAEEAARQAPPDPAPSPAAADAPSPPSVPEELSAPPEASLEEPASPPSRSLPLGLYLILGALLLLAVPVLRHALRRRRRGARVRR